METDIVAAKVLDILLRQGHRIFIALHCHHFQFWIGSGCLNRDTASARTDIQHALGSMQLQLIQTDGSDFFLSHRDFSPDKFRIPHLTPPPHSFHILYLLPHSQAEW